MDEPEGNIYITRHAESLDGEITKQRFFLKLFISLFILIAFATGGFYAYQRVHPNKTGLSSVKDLAAQVSFPVYYPKALPTGTSYVDGSAKKENDVVSYKINYDSKNQLSVSIQLKPTKFDVSQLGGTSSFTTGAGLASLIGQGDKQSISIVNDKDWILISTPDKINIDKAKKVAEQLQAI